MIVVWSKLAMEDRSGIFDRIEVDNPRAAVALDERISVQAQILAQFPAIGRFGRVDGTRELVIAPTPYILAYRVIGDTVRILRILHGARQWPDVLS